MWFIRRFPARDSRWCEPVPVGEPGSLQGGDVTLGLTGKQLCEYRLESVHGLDPASGERFAAVAECPAPVAHNDSPALCRQPQVGSLFQLLGVVWEGE
jgi:hypothetical protein